MGAAQPRQGSPDSVTASSVAPTGGALGRSAPQTALRPSPVMPRDSHQVLDLALRGVVGEADVVVRGQ